MCRVVDKIEFIFVRVSRLLAGKNILIDKHDRIERYISTFVFRCVSRFIKFYTLVRSSS